jgi:hypothetical protein
MIVHLSQMRLNDLSGSGRSVAALRLIQAVQIETVWPIRQTTSE